MLPSLWLCGWICVTQSLLTTCSQPRKKCRLRSTIRAGMPLWFSMKSDLMTSIACTARCSHTRVAHSSAVEVLVALFSVQIWRAGQI